MFQKIYDIKYIKIFFILQPIIDALTSLISAGSNLSIGIVVRALFLLYAFIYILFVNKNVFYKVFSCLLVLFGGIFLLDKGPFLFSEISYLVKFAYFPIVTLFLIAALKKEDITNIFNYNALTISIIFLSAIITNSGMSSYYGNKIGMSAWFFSANEISSILSLLFPFVYLKFYQKFNPMNTITLILTLIAMFCVGTKATALSIFITLILFLFLGIIKRKTVLKSIIVLVLITISLPITPIYSNMGYHFILLESDHANNDEDTNITEEDVENLLFYGRENYVKIVNERFKEAPLRNKLLGLGVNTSEIDGEYNYSTNIVERDFHDIFYCYGIIGTILMAIFVFYTVITVLIKAIKHKLFFNEEFYAHAVSAVLALGIAFIAGHTLMAPAVAIYVAFTIAMLYNYPTLDKEKRVLFISSVGGHLTQLLELKKLFNDYNYLLVTEKTDVTINMKDKYNMSFLPYGSRNQKLTYPFILLWNIIKSFFYLVDYNPSVIVTTGANSCAAMCCFGKIFGKKVIYIESFAKRTSPTITGKYIYKLHAYTVFVVQWESMLEFYPKAKYWGGIY